MSFDTDKQRRVGDTDGGGGEGGSLLPVLCLKVMAGVPVWIKDHHLVGSSHVEAQPSGSGQTIQQMLLSDHITSDEKGHQKLTKHAAEKMLSAITNTHRSEMSIPRQWKP